MLSRSCPLSRLLLRGCSGQQAVLASAYASAAAAPAARQADAQSVSNDSAGSQAAVAAGLQRLKEQLAAGPDLGDFVAGDAADDGQRAAPYSVYAPSFKVRSESNPFDSAVVCIQSAFA